MITSGRGCVYQDPFSQRRLTPWRLISVKSNSLRRPAMVLLTLYLIDATDRRLIDNDPARNDDQKTFTYRAFIA
jgi:hypothetical protein